MNENEVLIERVIDVENAQRLNSLGFDWKTRHGYDVSNELVDITKFPDCKYVSAPLIQDVSKWLRDNHNIHYNIVWQNYEMYGVTFFFEPDSLLEGVSISVHKVYTTYEEAELEAISIAISLLSKYDSEGTLTNIEDLSDSFVTIWLTNSPPMNRRLREEHIFDKQKMEEEQKQRALEFLKFRKHVEESTDDQLKAEFYLRFMIDDPFLEKEISYSELSRRGIELKQVCSVSLENKFQLIQYINRAGTTLGARIYKYPDLCGREADFEHWKVTGTPLKDEKSKDPTSYERYALKQSEYKKCFTFYNTTRSLENMED